MKKEKIQTSYDNKDIAKFLEKIVVNIGVGRLSSQGGFEDKILPQIIKDISSFCGQKPQPRPAKKSIAGFKTREGQTVGLRVTLRGKRMVDFFIRMINIVLPRVKDFTGIKLSVVDDGGVLNIGIREQYVFPEIIPEQSLTIFPLEVTIVPKIKNREIALNKYRELGVPLKKK